MTTEHTQRKHARLSASRTERFMLCPGSVRLESQMPYEPAGPAAAIGTAIHEVAELLLNGSEPAKLLQDGTDPEYVAMAQGYADYVNTVCESPRKRMIEVNVDAGLKSLHHALGGTADAVLVDGNTLHVIDLKTGRVPVPAEDNLQLMTYALGVMRQLKAPSDITVVMHIYQPRTGSSTATLTGQDLIEHGERLKAAAELALTDDAPTEPGSSQCKYCRAKTICPSLKAKAAAVARSEFMPSNDVTPEMLEDATLVSAWADAVIDQAKQQIANDKPINGWVLRKGRTTKFWRAPEMVAEALRANPDAWDLKSPAAIAKLSIPLPDDMVGEKQSAPSLVKAKS